MAQHTPGPWKSAETFANNVPSTWNVYAKPEPGSKRFNGECVAVCETPANAALIAAAPDMYEALHEAQSAILEALNAYDEPTPNNPAPTDDPIYAGMVGARGALLEALAKVEGR